VALRVGIDLVSVDDIAEALRRHGSSYLERLYTEAELSDCQGPQGPDVQRLAARFAAKEATLKVLRPAGESIPWHTIEVRRDASGWVELALSGSAADVAYHAGVVELSLSLTHEAGLACAVVIAELNSARAATDKGV
jgi:holo-[acyl-carrier protein] synthase